MNPLLSISYTELQKGNKHSVPLKLGRTGGISGGFKVDNLMSVERFLLQKEAALKLLWSGP